RKVLYTSGRFFHADCFRCVACTSPVQPGDFRFSRCTFEIQFPDSTMTNFSASAATKTLTIQRVLVCNAVAILNPQRLRFYSSRERRRSCRPSLAHQLLEVPTLRQELSVIWKMPQEKSFRHKLSALERNTVLRGMCRPN